MKTIDQRKRVEIERRIASGDRSAAEDLARLYEEAGYAVLAGSVRRASVDDKAWYVLRQAIGQE